jgi:hypothetical protein
MYKKGHKAPKGKKKAKLMAAIGNPILPNKSMTIKSHTPNSNYV